MNRQRLLLLTLAAACLLQQGCKHSPRAVQAATATPTAPPIQVPPPFVREDERKAEAKAPAPPQEEEPAQEEPQQPRRPARRRPAQPTQPATPPPAQTASAGTPAPDPASVIGELSTGGETSTQSRQQAGEFIATTQRRLEKLSGSLARTHKTAVDQVKDFLGKARDALKAGDVDGANTLTTKAKLLLDDIAR